MSQEADFSLPPPSPSKRDYSAEQDQSEPIPLYPNAPREKAMVASFKTLIIQHVEDRGEKTTEEFLDGLALELWRVTRRPPT